MGIRIDRVYTKTGDQGETHLVGGSRVSKDSIRVDCYGTVDEVNGFIGVCRSWLDHMAGPKDLGPELHEEWSKIQHDLFNMGADLATPPKGEDQEFPEPKLQASRIEALESTMDRWQEELSPLTSFVLPGGSPVPANLHLARVVCRRAERLAVHLSHQEPILGPAIQYLNRLSDYLFVCSRYVAKRLGEKEVLWEIG